MTQEQIQAAKEKILSAIERHLTWDIKQTLSGYESLSHFILALEALERMEKKHEQSNHSS